MFQGHISSQGQVGIVLSGLVSFFPAFGGTLSPSLVQEGPADGGVGSQLLHFPWGCCSIELLVMTWLGLSPDVWDPDREL